MSIKPKYYENNDNRNDIVYWNDVNNKDIGFQMRFGISSKIKLDEEDDKQFDNTKRINLNYSNLVTPPNKSNTGVGNIEIYNELLYPLQTRRIETDNKMVRELTINYDRMDDYRPDNYTTLQDEIFFRGGIDTRSNNKK